MSRTVVSLFDHSGRFTAPWAAAAYACFCVDEQHPPGKTWQGNDCLVGGDMRRFVPPPGPVAFVAAFPPCTDLSNAGAYLFRVKGLRRLAALDLVGAAGFCDMTRAPYFNFIENPHGQLRHYWREPDYQFDPCEYAGWLLDPEPEAYTNRTCLWAGHSFQMPEKRLVFLSRA